MAMFHRGPSPEIAEIDRWDDGVGWHAHPQEGGQRASHAIRGREGIWLFDPLDGPGLEAVIASLDAPVAGVLVCSSFHTRDAESIARRYDVPVTIAAWMDRVATRLDGPIARLDVPSGEWVEVDDSGILLKRAGLVWPELLAYRPADGTLRVPDILTTMPGTCVGDERLGMHLGYRLVPPRQVFADLEPERILVGHGQGIHTDATAALVDTMANARSRLPRALIEQGPTQIRSMLGALFG